MSDTVVSVENLCKRYVLSHQQPGSGDGLHHRIEQAIRSPWRWLRARHETRRRNKEEFWALRDVSLKIQRGEVLGIVGRNGAGKSTLLKILSRTTEPTSGRIRIRGRVASLLEVGTGFHPELTGRENIFLNGAVLGMTRSEIKRKFDEIVAFSQIERFLDTPVKRYSSGMYVRLAFAVAAHLEPEILVVDEVLAVGDAEFQKKCLNRMGDVARGGRTVLLVSHNMHAITRLCSRCVLLGDGTVTLQGDPTQVANAYLNFGASKPSTRVWNEKLPGDDVVRLRAARVISERGEDLDTIDIRKSVGIEMEYDVLKPDHVLLPNFDLVNEVGVKLFVAVELDPAWRGRSRPVGRYITTAWIPGNFLAEGVMFVSLSLMTLDTECVHFDIPDALSFRVVDCLEADNTARGDYKRPLPGVMRPLLKWSTRCTNSTSTLICQPAVP